MTSTGKRRLRRDPAKGRQRESAHKDSLEQFFASIFVGPVIIGYSAYYQSINRLQQHLGGVPKVIRLACPVTPLGISWFSPGSGRWRHALLTPHACQQVGREGSGVSAYG